MNRSALPLVCGRRTRVRLWRMPRAARRSSQSRPVYEGPLSVRIRSTVMPWAANQRMARSVAAATAMVAALAVGMTQATLVRSSTTSVEPTAPRRMRLCATAEAEPRGDHALARRLLLNVPY
jgi:hypothetical protein